MALLRLQLPCQFDGQSMCLFVQQFINACPAANIPERVEISFSHLRFIKPVGVTFLSNFVTWLYRKSISVSFVDLDYTAPVCFLDDSLFFEQHASKKLRQTASPRSTTMPLKSVRHQDSHAWIRFHMIPWLASTLNISKASLAPFQTCVHEIFNNINDHSTSDVGSVFVQHFPRENTVSISMADFGIGIPASVRRVESKLQDYEAIQRAVQDGFTSRTTAGNMGIGLDFLLKTVVGVNGGKVAIYSLGGYSSFVRIDATNQIAAHGFNLSGFCPGTTIDICFNTERIERLEEEQEDLEW